MKIAISAALVLGFVQGAAGFACTWNGAGSSYVYHEVDSTTGDYGDANCIATITDAYAQTTCCRCAIADECNADPPGDYNAVTTAYTEGCDLYAPDINIADAVEAASAPGMWFTSEAQLQTYLATTVQCTDDCVQTPTCEISYKPALDECANTMITVASSDWVGCDNENRVERSFYVRYDDKKPNVTVTLDEFLSKKSASTKWEDVPLTVRVEDNCDDNPEVTITVYSDEISVKNPHKTPAVLERQYSNTGNTGVLTGWGVTLDRTSYAKKLCGPTNECLEADGRYYIVRVCAKDAAGNWACAEDSVGVPLTPMERKKISPKNQGKLFVVAEDRGIWGASPDELSFRQLPGENSGLDMPVPAAYRLCNSNYGLVGGTNTTDTTETVEKCALGCEPPACKGFTYDFEPAEGEDNCMYFTTLGTRTEKIDQRKNIYVMPGVKCPVYVAGGGGR